jgi:hypothetical protein
MCVPKEESDGPPPPPGGDEITGLTSFGTDEEGNFIDFTDPEAVLEYAKSFDTPVLDGALGDSDTLKQVSLAGSLAGIPAIGAVAGLASLGNKIGSTTDIIASTTTITTISTTASTITIITADTYTNTTISIIINSNTSGTGTTG